MAVASVAGNAVRCSTRITSSSAVYHGGGCCALDSFLAPFLAVLSHAGTGVITTMSFFHFDFLDKFKKGDACRSDASQHYQQAHSGCRQKHSSAVAETSVFVSDNRELINSFIRSATRIPARCANDNLQEQSRHFKITRRGL